MSALWARSKGRESPRAKYAHRQACDGAASCLGNDRILMAYWNASKANWPALVQVPEGHQAEIVHSDGARTISEAGTHELPPGARLEKLEPKDASGEVGQ